eukprot:TRINITY_DN22979_c0_g1_i1.p1 TRINITY_DN22979_c0_g1~~TRINITY_DN22979_c0_g1_i1.p1  ORF type:complete len:712 (-),score=122.42 TRINITY_DN22979_c0_g1_i1:153-2255(-)
MAGNVQRIATDELPRINDAKASSAKGAAKLPRSAYCCFLAKKRAHFQTVCAGLGGAAVLQMAGRMWKELSEQERRPYHDEYQAKKRKYEESEMRKTFAKVRKNMRRAKVKDTLEEERRRPRKKSSVDEFRRVRPENILPLIDAGAEVMLQGLVSAPELNGQVARVVNYDMSVGRYIVKMASTGEQKRVRPEHATPCMRRGDNALLVSDTVGSETASSDCRGKQVRVQALDVESSQYRVRCAGSSKVVSASPNELKPLYKVGEILLFRGLAKSPELNGRRVQIKGFDDVNGRYIVHVLASKEDRCARPENVQLRLTDGSEAILHGLKQVDLNGKRVELQGFDEHVGRYIVSFSQAQTLDETSTCKLKRLWLASKAEVVLSGVVKLPELDGQVGLIEAIDESLGMYTVRLLKCARLELVEAKCVSLWFDPGTAVVIEGIPKYSGQLAKVEKFLASKREYVVRLEKNAELQRVKPEHVCRWFENKCKVVVTGLSSFPDPQIGSVEGFDNREGRYLVYCSKSSRRNLLRPEYLRPILPPRSFVKIGGLQSAPELNGKLGKLERFDDTKGRYMVRLLGSEAIRCMRPANVWAVTEAEVVEAEQMDAADEDDDDVKSVDTIDILDRLPQPASPAYSSSSSSSDSMGRRAQKRKREAGDPPTPAKLSHSLVRSHEVGKLMQAGRRAADGESLTTSSLHAFGLGHLCS